MGMGSLINKLFLRIRGACGFLAQRPAMMLLFFFLFPMVVSLICHATTIPLLLGDSEPGFFIAPDSIWFHSRAVEIAGRMKAEGFSAWCLRPWGQLPVGIASLIYYVFGTNPYFLLPFNALLHCGATYFFFRILLYLSGSRAAAFVVSLIYLIFPTATLWYTQLHKDGVCQLGVLLYLYGWIRLADGSLALNLRHVLVTLFLIAAGLLLSRLSRPYVVTMMMGVMVIGMLLVVVPALIRALKKKAGWPDFAKRSILAACCFAVLFVIPKDEHYEKMINGELPRLNATHGVEWHPSGWPGAIESMGHSIANYRARFIQLCPDQGSGIDTNVEFNSIPEILAYLPRAAQQGLLAPFPSEWFSHGSSAFSTLTRLVSSFEMLVVYIGLALLPLLFVRCEKRLPLAMVTAICASMATIYVFSVPNLGTVYRVRYIYLLLLAGFGLVQGFMLLTTKTNEVNR